MKKASVKSVASRLLSDFGIDMELHEVVQNCAHALGELGMIALDRQLSYHLVDNFLVQMPPSTCKIQWCISLSPTFLTPNRIGIQDIWQPPQIVFHSSEPETTEEEVIFKDNYINLVKGPFVDFSWECPYVKFNETKIRVAIMATSLSLDDEKYPKIPEAAVEACTQWCHMVYQRPLFVLGKVAPVVWGEIGKWVQQSFARAAQKQIMYGLSRNELDKMLNVMSSFDRKRFNIDA
jgi:hypothetical protein